MQQASADAGRQQSRFGNALRHGFHLYRPARFIAEGRQSREGQAYPHGPWRGEPAGCQFDQGGSLSQRFFRRRRHQRQIRQCRNAADQIRKHQAGRHGFHQGRTRPRRFRGRDAERLEILPDQSVAGPFRRRQARRSGGFHQRIPAADEDRRGRSFRCHRP